MTTLADQFHDSFDAYYAGKKSWSQPKPLGQPEFGSGGKRTQQPKQSEGESTPPESRH